MSAYYNEHDLKTAAWLRELIREGLIADGEVDTRSVIDVSPGDVRSFVQCHWFAGIGGWSYALRLAGWTDDRPVWTGSCPCQPFSSAGTQAGGHDPRDLWPAWFQLVKECRPDVVFGEQVEAAIAHGWLDRICDDLEAEGYAVGAVGLPSACVGAFDIRQRLWFVADTECDRRFNGGWASKECAQGPSRNQAPERSALFSEVAGLCHVGGVAYAEGEGRQRLSAEGREGISDGARRSEVGELADTDGAIESDGGLQRSGRLVQSSEDATAGELGEPESDGRERQRLRSTTSRSQSGDSQATTFWSDCDWIPCRDGKSRPVEPGTFPLAHGVPARVGRLRGYGNAINPHVAAEVIRAYCDVRTA